MDLGHKVLVLQKWACLYHLNSSRGKLFLASAFISHSKATKFDKLIHLRAAGSYWSTALRIKGAEPKLAKNLVTEIPCFA